MPKQKLTYVDWKGKQKTKFTDKWTINDMLPVKEYKDLSYCLLPDIEILCKNNHLDYKTFLDWMFGQTMPIIPEEGVNQYNCVYPWDLERWVYHHLLKRIGQPIVWD